MSDMEDRMHTGEMYLPHDEADSRAPVRLP